MNTIDAYEQEILYQIEDLPRMIQEMGNRWLSTDEQSRALITGNGDSLAAAMLVERLSSFMIQCMDPLEIADAVGSLHGKSTLYIISVSGSTGAALHAMSKAHEHGLNVVAITANPESRLAIGADSTIHMRFRRTGVLTAGSIGFTASLVAGASLAIRMDAVNMDMKDLFSKADDNARRITLGEHNYIVGDTLTYPLAMYGSAKLYEVLGARASYCRLEQFCHMEIFSLGERDKVLVLSSGEKARRLVEGLRSNGIDAILLEHLESSSSNDWSDDSRTLSRVIYYALLLQLTALHNARRLGLRECAFINHRLLGLSSSLIY